MVKLRMMPHMLERTEMATIENLSHRYCESQKSGNASDGYPTARENASRHSTDNIPRSIEGSIF